MDLRPISGIEKCKKTVFQIKNSLSNSDMIQGWLVSLLVEFESIHFRRIGGLCNRVGQIYIFFDIFFIPVLSLSTDSVMSEKKMFKLIFILA